MAVGDFELTLTGYAYGGEAFGRDSDGRMVFVPLGIPGERVRVTPIEEHAHWRRATIREILTASPDRIQARCKHFGDCGGCHYQHLPYDRQLAAKQAVLIDQLGRIGKLSEPPVTPPIPATEAWEYRNHIRYHLTESHDLAMVALTSDQLVEIEECYLPDPFALNLWQNSQLESGIQVDQVSLRIGTQQDRMIILHAQGGPDIELSSDSPDSVIWQTPDGWQVLAGDAYLTHSVFDHPFRVSPDAFFQVNSGQLERLVELTIGLLEPTTGQQILDLYSGVGLFSVSIARAGARLIAIEESPSAAEDFVTNLTQFNEIELYESSVELGLTHLEGSVDGVVLDPPRAGLSPQALAGLLELAPARIVYVSCDPATLARDAQRLDRAGYQMVSITLIDMFPQTYHIETVSLWRR